MKLTNIWLNVSVSVQLWWHDRQLKRAAKKLYKDFKAYELERYKQEYENLCGSSLAQRQAEK